RGKRRARERRPARAAQGPVFGCFPTSSGARAGQTSTRVFQNERRGVRSERQSLRRDPLAGALRELRSTAQTVLLHFPPERDRADFQSLGSVAPVAVKPLEGAFDRGSFLCAQIEPAVGSRGDWFLAHLRRQLPDSDAGARGNDDGALDRMLELADVSWP